MELGYRLPAEWEPHRATWIAWPGKRSDWPGCFSQIAPVFVEIVRLLHHQERVRILVKNAAERERVRRQLVSADVDVESIDLLLVETDRSWTRDYLPLFVTKGAKKAPRRPTSLGSVNFGFAGWARYPDYKRADAAGRAVSAALECLAWTPTGPDARGLVVEGGAIDVDGEGTLLATESCFLKEPRGRFQRLGREYAEQCFRDYLGITCTIWLGDGVAGDDTSGHVDDFVRFVEPGTLVLSCEENRRDPNYRPLAAARDRLLGTKDAAGRALRVIDLPMPAPVVRQDQRLPASYANFYIANGLVLVPTFNDPADRIALGILAELFPDREVVGVYCRDLVLGLGAIHCSTMQEPWSRPRTSL